MLTLDDFKKFYKTNGHLPCGIYTPKKLNEKQMNRKYEKYVTKFESTFDFDKKPDYYDDWIICREKVYTRDNRECRFWKCLNEGEKEDAKENGYSFYLAEITPAHFIRRSKSSALICEVDNVYTVSNIFHTRLDTFIDPITGKYIGKEGTLSWWKRIINDDVIFEKYKELF